MSSFLAMAGLAEAAFAQSLLIAWCGIFVIGALTIVGWFRRSWRIGLAAIIVALLVGFFLGPVEVLFGPEKNPEALNDPDYIYWLGCFRKMSAVWLIVIGLALALIPLIRKFPKNCLAHYSEPKGFNPNQKTI
jgi:hypothetical protein